MLKASVGAAVDIILKDYCMDLYTKRTKKIPKFCHRALDSLVYDFYSCRRWEVSPRFFPPICQVNARADNHFSNIEVHTR